MFSIEQIREAFQKVHRVATNQTREAYMTIPPDPKRDADLIVGAAIDELERLRNERGQLVKMLQEVVRSDRTTYQHHEARPFDGLLPSEAGGTIWLTPKEMARHALSAMGERQVFFDEDAEREHRRSIRDKSRKEANG